MSNYDQYEFERYIPTLRKAANKYATYFANDKEEAFAEFSLKVYEAIVYYRNKNHEFNEALAYTISANHAKKYMAKQLRQCRGAGKQFANAGIDDQLTSTNCDIADFINNDAAASILNDILSIANEKQRIIVEHRLNAEKSTFRDDSKELDIAKSTIHYRLTTLHKKYKELRA